MLERARAGELTAIAIAACHRDGGVSTVFHITPAGNLWQLAGGIEELRYRLFHEGVEQLVANDDPNPTS